MPYGHPYGFHMDDSSIWISICHPYGIHIDSIWPSIWPSIWHPYGHPYGCPYGIHMASIWHPYGIHMAIHIVSIWPLHDSSVSSMKPIHMDAIWTSIWMSIY